MLRSPRLRGARRFSCPPLALSDMYYGFDGRAFRDDVLSVSPEFWGRFPDLSTITLISQDEARAIYRLDEDLCLKLLPVSIDVEHLAQTMRTASQVVPVPRIHQFGRSDNCSYLLMDWVHGQQLFDARILEKQFPSWVITAKLEGRVARVVEDLARLGIAHNDLYHTNLFVDRYWGISALIDWDAARERSSGEEYLRRVQSFWRPHDWDYMFARHCRPFGNAFVASPIDGNRTFNGMEPFLPFLSVTGGNHHPMDAPPPTHVLSPESWAAQLKRPDHSAVLLCGGNGDRIGDFLDSNTALCGVRVSRAFTALSPSRHKMRGVVITALSDLTALSWTADEELIRLVVRECPSIVILVNWDRPLSPAFFTGMACPTDLCDPESFPRVFNVRGCVTEAQSVSPSPDSAGLPLTVTVTETMLSGELPVDVVLFEISLAMSAEKSIEEQVVHAQRAAIDQLVSEYVLESHRPAST